MDYKRLDIIILAVLSVLFQSCGSQESNLEKGSDVKMIEVDMGDASIQHVSLHELLEPIAIVPLETSPSSFISSIKRVTQVDSLFMVLDDNLDKLLMFDMEGRFLRKVGSQGQGPGEYLDIADFCFDENRRVILALSVEKQCIYEYSIAGEHLRTVMLPFQSNGICMLDNERIASYLGYYDIDNKNLKITDLDAKDVLYSGFEFPESMYAMNLSMVSGHITKNQLGCLYSDATSSYIHQIVPNGKTYPKYYIDFGNSSWEEDRRYDLRSFFNGIQAGQLNFLTNNYEENDDALVFKYNRRKISGSENVIRFFNGYYIKSTNELFTDENINEDLFASILSGPLGLTCENQFISVVRIEDYKKNVSTVGKGVAIRKMDSILTSSKLGDNPLIFVYDVHSQR